MHPSPAAIRRAVRCWQRRQRLPVLDPFPFNDRIDVVAGNILERLRITIAPANLNRFYLVGGAQTEVQAQVVLRQVAPPAANFAELLDTAGMDGHAGANRGPVALRADELKEDTVKPVGVHVLKKRWRFADVQ